MGEMSIGRAMALRAARHPDRVAVHEVASGRAVTFAEIDREATALARRWRPDVAADDRVVVALGTSAAFVRACLAIWRLGATPVPIDPALAGDERAAVLDAADPALVVAGDAAEPPADPGGPDLPDLVASSWKAPASGGSTGPPKIVESTGPATVDPDAPVAPYLPTDQVQLVAGPLHHSAPFTYALRGLMTGHTLVLLPRFSPRAVLAAIAEHRVSWALLVPAMMHRIARLPDGALDAADLSSLETLLHLGAPCPPALKRTWIARLGAERVVEVYASSESAGIAMIRGDEWLAHPGSVGRGVGGSEFRVVDPDGRECAPGDVGEVLMIRPGGPRYRYRGAPARVVPGWAGWTGLGDLGWRDAQGYLFLVDRDVDTITLPDGAVVHPAPVEAALEAHPAVRSAAVVGIGEPVRVHALLDLDGGGSVDEVLASLPPDRRPASAEAVGGPLRDDAGKVRRARLAADAARRWASRSG